MMSLPLVAGFKCPSLISNRKAPLDSKNVAGWLGLLKQQP